MSVTLAQVSNRLCTINSDPDAQGVLGESSPNAAYSKADCGAHAVGGHTRGPLPNRSIRLGDNLRFYAAFLRREVATVSCIRPCLRIRSLLSSATNPDKDSRPAPSVMADNFVLTAAGDGGVNFLGSRIHRGCPRLRNEAGQRLNHFPARRVSRSFRI